MSSHLVFTDTSSGLLSLQPSAMSCPLQTARLCSCQDTPSGVPH
jgi:hypothetical protein